MFYLTDIYLLTMEPVEPHPCVARCAETPFTVEQPEDLGMCDIMTVDREVVESDARFQRFADRETPNTRLSE